MKEIGKLLLAVGLLWLALRVEASVTVSEEMISLSSAQRVAVAAMSRCDKMGFSAVVTVVDHRAQLKAVLVADGAFPHAIETSFRKAKTAASRRTPSGEVVDENDHEDALGDAFHAIGLTSLGGGVPIIVAGKVVGGIGIAGAPGEDEKGRDYDLQCAAAGLQAIGLSMVNHDDD